MRRAMAAPSPGGPVARNVRHKRNIPTEKHRKRTADRPAADASGARSACSNNGVKRPPQAKEGEPTGREACRGRSAICGCEEPVNGCTEGAIRG